MKLISVSSLLYYVNDIAKTKEFYEAIGFNIENKGDRVVTYLNWFSIEFRQESVEVNKDNGAIANIKVDNLEELFEKLKVKGIIFDGEPQNVVNGISELLVHDPDGYKLIFFSKK